MAIASNIQTLWTTVKLAMAELRIQKLTPVLVRANKGFVISALGGVMTNCNPRRFKN
jgi:hypothetical protein